MFVEKSLGVMILFVCCSLFVVKKVNVLVEGLCVVVMLKVSVVRFI